MLVWCNQSISWRCWTGWFLEVVLKVDQSNYTYEVMYCAIVVIFSKTSSSLHIWSASANSLLKHLTSHPRYVTCPLSIPPVHWCSWSSAALHHISVHWRFSYHNTAATDPLQHEEITCPHLVKGSISPSVCDVTCSWPAWARIYENSSRLESKFEKQLPIRFARDTLQFVLYFFTSQQWNTLAT